MRKSLLLLLSATLVSGCVGATAGNFKPAQHPTGIELKLETASVDFQGELLELRQDALLVRTSLIRRKAEKGKPRMAEQQIRLVPFNAIRNASFQQLKWGFHEVRIRNGRAPARQDLERLRLASRFPYGIEPTVLSALLKAHGQTTLRGIEP